MPEVGDRVGWFDAQVDVHMFGDVLWKYDCAEAIRYGKFGKLAVSDVKFGTNTVHVVDSADCRVVLTKSQMASMEARRIASGHAIAVFDPALDGE